MPSRCSVLNLSAQVRPNLSVIQEYINIETRKRTMFCFCISAPLTNCARLLLDVRRRNPKFSQKRNRVAFHTAKACENTLNCIIQLSTFVDIQMRSEDWLKRNTRDRRAGEMKKRRKEGIAIGDDAFTRNWDSFIRRRRRHFTSQDSSNWQTLTFPCLLFQNKACCGVVDAKSSWYLLHFRCTRPLTRFTS